MKEPQILSTFSELPGAQAPAPVPGPVLVFDACQVGVVLRAVLFVEAVMAVGAMYGAEGPRDWLDRSAFLSGGALPAALAWLLVACSLKRVLARLPAMAQRAFGVGLGALAGLYGCAMLALVTQQGAAPWVASAFTGALLSAALGAGLGWGAKGRPAGAAARR